jgi:hypothetical protein
MGRRQGQDSLLATQFTAFQLRKRRNLKMEQLLKTVFYEKHVDLGAKMLGYAGAV